MSNKVDIFMPLFVADYLADTTDLTAEEHGAYMLILMALWRQGGRLQNDPVRLARIAKVQSDRWGSVWETLERFFVVHGGAISQGRLAAELEKAKGRRSAAAENGAKGAAARWGGHGQAIAPPIAESVAKNDSSPSESHSESKPESSGGPPRAISPGPLTPEAYLPDAIARSGGLLTGTILTTTFGLVRSEAIAGSLPWASQKSARNAVTLAAAIGADPLAVADVVPSMRRMFSKALGGGVTRADEVVKDPSFAFGHWCSTFTRLREEIRGVSPSAKDTTRCWYHQRSGTNGKANPRGADNSCVECRHVSAGKGARAGEPTAPAAALPTYKPAPEWTPEQRAEMAESIRKGGDQPPPAAATGGAS